MNADTLPTRGSGTTRRVLFLALLFVLIVPTAWAILHERSLIQRAGAAETTAFWGYHELVGQSAIVKFQRDSGAGRPYILAEDGTQVMEFSDWGDSSWIFVDDAGATKGTEMLYLHPHGYAVSDSMISQSMQGDSWELVQNVTIAGPRTVKVQYYFTARSADIRQAKLSLSHYHWYFSNVTRFPTGFTANVSDTLDRDDIARGVTAPPKFNVSLRTEQPQFLSSVDPISIGFSDARGVANVVTHYEARNLERDVMTLIASEVISWEPLNP